MAYSLLLGDFFFFLFRAVLGQVHLSSLSCNPVKFCARDNWRLLMIYVFRSSLVSDPVCTAVVVGLPVCSYLGLVVKSAGCSI